MAPEDPAPALALAQECLAGRAAASQAFAPASHKELQLRTSTSPYRPSLAAPAQDQVEHPNIWINLYLLFGKALALAPAPARVLARVQVQVQAPARVQVC